MSLRRLCQLTGGGGGIAEDEVVEAGVCNSLGGGVAFKAMWVGPKTI